MRWWYILEVKKKNGKQFGWNTFFVVPFSFFCNSLSLSLSHTHHGRQKFYFFWRWFLKSTLKRYPPKGMWEMYQIICEQKRYVQWQNCIEICLGDAKLSHIKKLVGGLFIACVTCMGVLLPIELVIIIIHFTAINKWKFSVIKIKTNNSETCIMKSPFRTPFWMVGSILWECVL